MPHLIAQRSLSEALAEVIHACTAAEAERARRQARTLSANQSHGFDILGSVHQPTPRVTLADARGPASRGGERQLAPEERRRAESARSRTSTLVLRESKMLDERRSRGGSEAPVRYTSRCVSDNV